MKSNILLKMLKKHILYEIPMFEYVCPKCNIRYANKLEECVCGNKFNEKRWRVPPNPIHARRLALAYFYKYYLEKPLPFEVNEKDNKELVRYVHHVLGLQNHLLSR